jgi:3-hydroxy acid dehydrogenase/malonic semialdehyde reductase
MNRIQGKLALITGASSGIGLSCARRLAAEGANLVLWARRRARLEAVAGELAKAHGVRATTDGVDVRDRAAVNRSAGALAAAGIVPDILLNNAGLAAGLAKLQEGAPGPPTPPAGAPHDWDRMIDTNLKGLLNVSRAILPLMVERGTGHVVNIGSTAGHQVYPGGNVYNATKFGVKALTEGMNLDVAGTRIRVSSVDPGHVRTEFAEVRFHGDTARAEKVYEGFRPLSPDDVADAVAYIVNAPDHVNVFDLIILPAAQRSVHLIDRSTP